MKNLFSFIVILLLFNSCQEEVKFNNPGFQAYKDDVLWRAASVTAYKSPTGALRIEAFAEDGEVVLKTTYATPGTFPLGTSVSKTATYTYTKDGADLFYTTGIDIGDGQIKITENSNNTVTGEFKFNARNVESNPLGGELVNFQYGKFYKIPIVIEP